MFPCACSLRSTQCAALIALAAAAGISRLGPTKALPVTEAGDARVVFAEQPAVAQRTAAFYQVALQAFAPWLRLFAPSSVSATTSDTAGSGMSATRGHPGNGSVCALLALSGISNERATSAVVYFPATVLMPSARSHSFPYAVGPPAREHANTRRVVGTEVPGDSAARVELVEDFAVVYFVLPPMRARHPSDRFAGSIQEPSSALRGEPERFSNTCPSRLPRHVARVCRPHETRRDQ
jgi:hypothetical protein